MLASMTGYGEACGESEGHRVVVDVRSVNNRYFKLAIRLSDALHSLESQIERDVRAIAKRGSVQVSVQVSATASRGRFGVNPEVLTGYREELNEVARAWPELGPPSWAALLQLPGVISEREDSWDVAAAWQAIRPVLSDALEQFQKMRAAEAQAMRTDLVAQCDAIEKEVLAVEADAPLVATQYRDRIQERVAARLRELDVRVDSDDLIREVSIFADRSDVSEETVRLRSHIEQFRAALDEEESAGRKLEFITQEMFREANTVGSKAGATQISRRVVEIKAAIERIREMIQNVE